MSDLELQIKRISEKLQKMLKQRELLLKENVRLKQEIAALRNEKENHQQSIEKLQQQLEVIKLSGSGMDEEGKRQLEKRLGQYIKEIDRCIALLQE